MAPELVEAFIDGFNEEVTRLRRNSEGTRQAKEQECARVSSKLEGLYDAIADGLRTPGLKEKLEALEQRKRELTVELATPPASPPSLHPNLAKLYREKVARLHEAVRDPAIRDEALTILRSLIERVMMHPAKGGFGIELVGEIAKMIELSAGAESSKVGAYGSSVKVVAGVGFEPTTFRL